LFPLKSPPGGRRRTIYQLSDEGEDATKAKKVRDEVSQAALGHPDTNRVRSAYRRTDFLAGRRELLAA
jgi:hypothetical protein